jgi:hypothetical protein
MFGIFYDYEPWIANLYWCELNQQTLKDSEIEKSSPSVPSWEVL